MLLWTMGSTSWHFGKRSALRWVPRRNSDTTAAFLQGVGDHLAVMLLVEGAVWQRPQHMCQNWHAQILERLAHERGTAPGAPVALGRDQHAAGHAPSEPAEITASQQRLPPFLFR